MKPLIAITVESQHDPEDARTRGKLELNWNYPQAIADAGGIPLVIPPMADMTEVASLIHGWLIPGGLDIDAAQFGEENHPSVELQDPSRYEGESALYRAIHPTMPILGICYGCQFLNVVNGGTLIQHVPDEVNHEGHSGGTLQRYELAEDSLLATVTGVSAIEGKSYHHQAIRRTAESLRVVAASEDGIIEAVESKSDRWMIGVQWHPERTLEDGASQRLFREFVEAARIFALTRVTK